MLKRGQHSPLSQILDKKLEYSFECNKNNVFDSKVLFNMAALWSSNS